jgi:hypothetical protein
MDYSNESPTRRRALALAAGAGVLAVAGLGRSAPARAAGIDGISDLIAVTQRKAEEASNEALVLGSEGQRALIKQSEGRIRESDARRVRSQALLSGHLKEIQANLGKLQELLKRC